jgi:UDP-N-acetylglucosamine:LPS N-acetylglucosamine transferase
MFDAETIRRTKIVAVSSGGGHWVQLLRLKPAFADCDVMFVTVKDGYRADVSQEQFCTVPDANRSNKLNLARTALSVLWLLLRQRPDVVISTGAAPGYFAIRFGKILGARTIWVDSIANVETLSMSGQQARRYADLWLTQWPHLTTADGPLFSGSVL